MTHEMYVPRNDAHSCSGTRVLSEANGKNADDDDGEKRGSSRKQTAVDCDSSVERGFECARTSRHRMWRGGLMHRRMTTLASPIRR